MKKVKSRLKSPLTSADEGLILLQNLRKYIKNIAGFSGKAAHEIDLTSEDYALIRKIQASKFTYLSIKKLASISNTCQSIEAAKLSGIYLEAGCALGGSAILIANQKKNERPLYIYDVFGVIPPPTFEDTQDVHDRYRTILEGKSEGIDGDEYYGYQPNLYEVVLSNLKNFGINSETQSVTLIKGLIQDTMNINQSVAFAHVDVDWYEPVLTCLKRIFPKLVVGGSIILDDYHDWGGCRKATDEFLKGVIGQFSLDDAAGSMKITRVRE